MIGLSRDLVRHVDDDVLQFWTDAKAGSSGSPVFNKCWEVVRLATAGSRRLRGRVSPT